VAKRKRQVSEVATQAITDPIFDTIKDRIMTGRLRPGTKLSEEEIASIFQVGRARARQSLRLLGAIGVVTLHRNRGAFVARPTRAEAAQIYAARRIIECPVVALVADAITRADVARLRRHVEQQAASVRAGDRREFLRLVLEFHNLLASIAGNPVIAQLVDQLIARASLISLLYEVPVPSQDVVDDHARLVELIAAGDADKASAHMERHLRAVETRLAMDDDTEQAADLRTILLAT
jgi:DNA-binding GntR family transcriptional regulator